ncbi:hypothetical protein EBU95_21855, partial [bacterium]|nr:hypothetical protein [bacterium]
PTPTPSPTTSPTPTPTPSPTPAFSFFVSAAGSDPAFAEDGVQKISIVSPNPYNYTDSIYYNNGGSALDFYTISIYVDNNFRSLINYTSDREGTNFGYRSDGVTSPYPQFIGVFANNTNIYFTT